MTTWFQMTVQAARRLGGEAAQKGAKVCAGLRSGYGP